MGESIVRFTAIDIGYEDSDLPGIRQALTLMDIYLSRRNSDIALVSEVVRKSIVSDKNLTFIISL